MSNFLNREKVKQILPQKDPFRFIDAVEKFSLDKQNLVALQTFGEIKGHFPGSPIVPGVLLTESIAQAGLILITLIKDTDNLGIGYLAQVEKVKFFKQVTPGEKLRLSCTLIKSVGKYYYISGEVYSDDLDRRCAKGTVIVCL